MLSSLTSCSQLDDLDETEERQTRELLWTTFGTMFSDRNAPLGELQAQERYARERPERVIVLSQQNRGWSPHGAMSPFRFALLCALPVGATPPALDEFCALELCIIPDDFSWAMVHSHEDVGRGAGMGGPYFIDAAKVPTTAGLPRPRRR